MIQRPEPGWRPLNTPPPAPGKLCPRWVTPDGWSVLQVNFWAVPQYPFESACKGISKEDAEREVLICWQHRKGMAVTPWFSQQTHVATSPIPYDPGRPLHIGFDPASQPTIVITQLNLYRQWCILSCVQVPEDEKVGIYEFGCMCAEHLITKYAEPHEMELEDLRLVWIGDPQGAYPPARVGEPVQRAGAPKEIRSAFDILRDGVEVFVAFDERGRPIYERRTGWGWSIQPGEVSLLKRLEALEARGRMLVGQGAPALVVDPECQLVIDALSGGWHYHQRNTGAYELDPEQDWSKDLGDALSYIPAHLAVKPQDRDREHAAPPAREYRATTARRRR